VVPSQRLDSFSFDNVGYIKIDVEGFEEFVLKGARETIMKSRPMIWIEMSPGHLSRAGSSVDKVLGEIEDMRYFPAFCKGSSQQCDVMMVPIEKGVFYMHVLSRISHVLPLASFEDPIPMVAFAELRRFFQDSIIDN
jgi:hypothetical protein